MTTKTKKDLKQLAIIWLLAVAAGVFCIWFIQHSLPAGAAPDPKLDQQCTGLETAGRCSDKCPTGSYEIGRDKDDGAAVCHLDPTGCPYGDSVPLGPECDKLAAEQTPPADPGPVDEFAGK